MSKYYAGIGSRKTPNIVLEIMTDIAKHLAKEDYILRSGAADGADTAFEDGAGAKKNIYLPWPTFNDRTVPYIPITKEAKEIAAKFHPYWDNLGQGAQKLHARNCYQVLGETLDKPAEFIICWTPGGKEVGGTAQAIRIAKANNVKVYNLAKKEDMQYWSDKIV